MLPRDAADLWGQLVEEAGEELIAQAAAVPVEQAERELRAAGFDVASERRTAERVIATLTGTLPQKST